MFSNLKQRGIGLSESKIQNETSSDVEREKVKLCKDRADLLSLLDPDAGGTETDVRYLRELLHEYPFLAKTLKEIPNDRDAINMYWRMDRKEAMISIENLLLLALEKGD